MTEKIEARIEELNGFLEKNKQSLASNNASLVELKNAIKDGEMRSVAISNRIAELNELLAQEASD